MFIINAIVRFTIGPNDRRFFDGEKFIIRAGEFKNITGCPVIVNTSFNVRGEPIVCFPEDAFRCFMGTELDILAIGNCYLKKKIQDPNLKKDYSANFELD